MLATPTNRDLCPSYTLSIVATAESLARFGVRFDLFILDGDCHVDDARNYVIREFLATDCTDLFFLDSDVGWQAKDLLRLLRAPGDIVGGIYPHKNDLGTYPFHPGFGVREANEHGLFSMHKVPTGFMRIRRPVLQALYDFEMKRGRGTLPQAPMPGSKPIARIVERAFPSDLPFKLPETTEYTYHSGDYVLCLKAQHLGFSVWADPECAFSHVGSKVWTGHLGDHLRREQGLDHPEFVALIGKIKAGAATRADYDALVNHSSFPPFCLPGQGLERCYGIAKAAQGDILECGSGFSTLVLGAALMGSEHTLYVLEHDLAWLNRVAAWVERYELANVRLIYAPMYPRETGNWYGVTEDELPSDFDIALIDGPPRAVGGDRRLAFEVLGNTLTKTRVLVIDDCKGTDEEKTAFEGLGPREFEWIEDISGDAHHLICIAQLRQSLSIAAE